MKRSVSVRLRWGVWLRVIRSECGTQCVSVRLLALCVTLCTSCLLRLLFRLCIVLLQGRTVELKWAAPQAQCRAAQRLCSLSCFLLLCLFITLCGLL